MTFRSDAEYLIDTWETEDGLPENSATAMVQTPDGYLWFGTWNGLARFDGVKFTVLNPGNTPQLPSDGIVNLHLDRSGRLWVSTLKGLVVMERGEGQGPTGKWRSFGTNDGWAGDFVRTFSERANGDLLLTTFDGHLLEFAGGRLKELPPPSNHSNQGYFGAVDETGRWWVAQGTAIGHWDGQGWVETKLSAQSQSDPGVPMLSARDGGVWVLFGKELLKFRQGAETSRLPLPQLSVGIWSLCEDSRTNVWICSYNAGLFRLDPRGALRHWTTTNGLPNLGCRFVFEDRERNLWVGTGGGLTRFKPRRFHEVGMATLLARSQAKSISPASDGGMWLATYDKGLLRQDALGVSHTDVPIARNESRLGLSVLEDRAGRLWYGTKDGCWWRPDSGSFQVGAPARSTDANISGLFEDSKGRVWVAGRLGVVMYEDGRFQKFGAAAGLPPGEVSCFGEHPAGVPWLAAGSGVFRYETDRFVEVRTVNDQALREVVCFKADPDGTMWMGTRKQGLLRLRNGRLSVIGPAAGLPTEAVHAILDDGLGYFWLTSNHGIVRAARQDLHAVANGAQARLACQLLDQHDGLPSAECSTSQPSCARDPSGRLWFATQRGVAMIDPASFQLNSLPPPVHIEQVDYHPSGGSFKTGARQPPGASGVRSVRLLSPFLEPLRLPPGSYGLEIMYTALSLSSPEKVRFQTKLEGSGGDWEDAKGLWIARFFQLQPGDFVFRVRAANNDGVWNEAGTSLAFTVQPFFWQTWWFRGAVGFLLAAGGGGAVRWRHRVKGRMLLADMERVRRESAEREKADQKFRLTVEASPNGIVLVNSDGRMVLVNTQTEELFGYSRGELVGHTVDMLLPERFRSSHPGHRAGFLAAPKAVMGAGRELFARRKDGTEFPAEIGLSPIQTEEGTLILTAIVDITERKKADEELAQQRHELSHLSRVSTMSELSSSLAHELNQPLAIILTNAQAAQRLLAQEPPDVAETRDILADIVSEDERAGEVIRRLRALLKPGQTHLLELSVNETIEDVLRIARSDLIGHSVAVRTTLAECTPRVLGDRIQLQQVLLNLILNASDAVAANPPAHRHLTIATAHRDGLVRISVSDNGCGLPPEPERIFQPFYTTKKEGMGLGLAICRSIATAHQGRLWAEARGAADVPPGAAATGGTTLHLEMPASEGASDQ